MNILFRKILLIIAFLGLFTTICIGAGANSSGDPKDFKAGKFVIDHVSDSFEWHIASFGETHISVPLPIILYSTNSGWNVFMSSKFHHGKETYKGFRIEQEGENAGKIIEVNEFGKTIGLPLDISITKTVAGVFVSMIVIFWLFIGIARTAKKNLNEAPAGVQNLFEPIIIFVRDEIAKPSIGNHNYQRFMPFLLTTFFFILINNILGLIPIFPFGANVTGNIAVTLVLAMFTFFMTSISANKHYWKEIYNPDVLWWLKFPIPLMPIVELSGLITKPFVLMVRLFANMMAGHLIVTVLISLIFIFNNLMGIEAGYVVSSVSVLFSVFILLLDILVSFIQAYVFTLLSALYFGMATAEHH